MGKKFFFAYPNEPLQLGQTIESAISKFNSIEERILSWKAMDINGKFIEEKILEEISDRIFVADITYLNFNVVFEIGYAIGAKREIILVRNRTFEEKGPTILQVGIFDTIGYAEYATSDDLVTILKKIKASNPHSGNNVPNVTAPVYIVDAKYKSDFTTRIISRVKKARLGFRTFDPTETTRMSALTTIADVAQSRGVLLSLLPASAKDSKIHNIRTSFVAGLAFGMDKARLILSIGTDSAPIDVRDFVSVYNRLESINDYIHDFAMNVVELMQQSLTLKIDKSPNILEKLNLGASAAENEMRTLQYYYLKTDAYFKAIRGEVQLVVGRKGSGKTAIFIQIRDSERTKQANVVLDLMPDGYQLIKFKEQVLDFLEEGTMQHTITGFWEYILLLEICHKVLETDKNKRYIEKKYFDAYEKLDSLYKAENYLTEGDFSERMARLLESIGENYTNTICDVKQNTGLGLKENKVRLSHPEVTDLIYKGDIKPLRIALIDYLSNKKTVWLLFDNVDKGWPSTGLSHEDLIIIRSLIDSARKIQKLFTKNRIEVFPIIFLRNDVYELLVKESSDRQKEGKVLLDWTDPDLLRQIIYLRIKGDHGEGYSFDQLWRQLCVSHYKGEDSFNYLIDRSLMRPRFLLNLITHCRSFAVNLNHSKIQEEDLAKGIEAYSHDLVQDINYEIQDIFPKANGILHKFISSKAKMSLPQLQTIIFSADMSQMEAEKIIELLLWYGFIGIEYQDDVKYIYSLNYDIEVLKALILKAGEDAILIINPAFWPGLLIYE